MGTPFYENASIFSRVIAENEDPGLLMRICEGDVYDESAYEAVVRLREALGSIKAETAHPLNRILHQSAIL